MRFTSVGNKDIATTAADTTLLWARQKSIPLKNFANFSRTIVRYDIRVYKRVTYLIARKSGTFHYIIYRIGKITLILVTAT